MIEELLKLIAIIGEDIANLFKTKLDKSDASVSSKPNAIARMDGKGKLSKDTIPNIIEDVPSWWLPDNLPMGTHVYAIVRGDDVHGRMVVTKDAHMSTKTQLWNDGGIEEYVSSGNTWRYMGRGSMRVADTIEDYDRNAAFSANQGRLLASRVAKLEAKIAEYEKAI